MSATSRDSKLPIYYQLYEILRANIVRGEWQPGDMLPSEPELIEHYRVSRITVRQALEALVNEGLIYRQQGRGTFVARPTVAGPGPYCQLYRRYAPARTRTGYQGPERRPGPGPPKIAERLNLEPGQELAHLERLHLANGEPMSVEVSYLVHRYCPGILRGNYATTPLREALERTCGIRLVRARQVIRASLASDRMAPLLAIASRSALLFIERASYSQQGLLVEFLRIYYRAGRYVLYNELQG